MAGLTEAINYLQAYKLKNPSADKSSVSDAFVRHFKPTRHRSIFACDGFAIRFCEANAGSFANVVLSLSALQPFDGQPFVVCVVRPDRLAFMLANTTFLNKISHSSKLLRTDNVRGSFLGSNILNQHQGVANEPANFAALFEFHASFSWAENLARLVEATNQIVIRDTRFKPTPSQTDTIMAAGDRASAALGMPRFVAIEREFHDKISRQSKAILGAAESENVNLRGNAIEQAITGLGNLHGLEDAIFDIDNCGRLFVDIKSKLLHRGSAPKAYNIDKMLTLLSKPGSIFALLLVGIDLAAQRISSRLIPVLDTTLLTCTSVQHHWAGRGSRGVTQLSGNFSDVLSPSYRPSIDVVRSTRFLAELLAL